MTYALRFPNNRKLNAGNISLSGLAPSGSMVAPIQTDSNVLCANLYAARAVLADSVTGNISFTNLMLMGWLDVSANASVDGVLASGVAQGTAPFTILSNTIVANLHAEEALHSDWADTANVAKALATTGASVDVSAAAPGTTGQVLKLTSATTATWQDDTSGSSNITNQNAFTITNAPQTDYALVATDAGNVEWQAQVVDSFHADYADTANAVAGADVSGQVSDSLHADWADTANVAKALATTGASVDVSAAAPGTTGQVLKLTSATTATWQNESAESGNASLIAITNDEATAAFYPLVAVSGTSGNLAPTVHSNVSMRPDNGRISANFVQLFNYDNGIRVGPDTTGARYLMQFEDISGAPGDVFIKWQNHGNVEEQQYPAVALNDHLTITNNAQVGYILTGTAGNTASWQVNAGSTLTAESFTGNSTATAGGTTTLTSTDDYVQIFTGASNQTCRLPSTSGKLGMSFNIVNMSSGDITVEESGTATVDTLSGVSSGIYACVATDGGADDWKKVASG